MKIHEFGRENPKTLLLIHPSVVKWDYFEAVIPLLQRDYHRWFPPSPAMTLTMTAISPAWNRLPPS